MWFLPPAKRRPLDGPVHASMPGRCSASPGVRFLVDATLGATLMVVVHLFVIQVSVVKGTSMEPLHDGDRLLIASPTTLPT